MPPARQSEAVPRARISPVLSVGVASITLSSSASISLPPVTVTKTQSLSGRPSRVREKLPPVSRSLVVLVVVVSRVSVLLPTLVATTSAPISGPSSTLLLSLGIIVTVILSLVAAPSLSLASRENESVVFVVTTGAVKDTDSVVSSDRVTSGPVDWTHCVLDIEPSESLASPERLTTVPPVTVWLLPAETAGLILTGVGAGPGSTASLSSLSLQAESKPNRASKLMSGSFFCSVLNTRLVIENLVLLLVCCPKVFVVAALLQTRTGDSNGYVWRCKGANSFKSIECHRRMWS